MSGGGSSLGRPAHKTVERAVLLGRTLEPQLCSQRLGICLRRVSHCLLVGPGTICPVFEAVSRAWALASLDGASSFLGAGQAGTAISPSLLAEWGS